MDRIDSGYLAHTSYFLFVVTTTDAASDESLGKIFADCWSRAMLNVNVLKLVSDRSLLLSTYFPYKEQCVNLTRHDFGVLTEDDHQVNQSFRELFPEKYVNLNGCPLSVAVTHNPPFNIFREESVVGINVDILDMIARVYNFTLHFARVNNSYDRSVMRRNGSSGGTFKLVIPFGAHRNADLVYIRAFSARC